MPGSNGHPRKTTRAQQRDAAARAPQPRASAQVPGPVPQGAPAPQGQVPPASPGQQQVTPSLEGVSAEFEALVAANQAKFAELAARGSSPDPFFLVHSRINHLIDAIAQATGPNGPRWAAMTRLGFEQYIAAELAQAGPATRRMQLAEGGRYTPAMIRDLARQTGTLHRAQ